MTDEADSPIIVPPPGQILRRAARTKIRKPSLLGDGGGHRFAATRRVQPRAATTSLEPRSSSDRSSSDHGESVESVSAPPEHVATSHTLRPESYGEETFIIDSYARDDDEDPQPPNIDIVPPTQDSVPILSTSPPPLDVSTATVDAMLLTPQPQVIPQPEPDQVPLPISPPTEVPAPRIELPPLPIHAPVPRPPLQPTPPIPAVSGPQRKERDKKGGLFGKWGGDKASKKAQKNASSEKESGFFGSLFGKKKQESEAVGSAIARETAQALLGSSKSSKNHVPPTSPGLPPGTSPNNYSRYPIHVERAIYRLSHIKLANPRRPLYEQVLISNLMFWYLGVINKAQSPTQPNGQPIPNQDQNAGTPDAEKQEGDQKERERAEMERLERERLEREQRERVEREAEMKKKETGRRGSLTKTPPGGSPGGGRRAEKPVKGPQYEMQHRVMEQEYGSYAAQAQQNVQLARIHSAPVGSANVGPGEQQQYPWGSSSTPQLAQPQPQSVQLYNPPDLPPSNRTAHSAPPRITSPSPDHRSKSPPAPGQHRPMNTSRYSPNSSQENLAAIPNGRPSGRSLSATALPSAPMYPVNGRSRKGASAYAAIPSGQGKRSLSSERRVDEKGFEEEDVPLAVWQQQRRR